VLYSILAVVVLVIQPGLTILEERYCEWEKGGLQGQLAVHADKLQQTEKAREDQVARAKSQRRLQPR